MSPRDDVMKSLNHEQPASLAVDFGTTGVTGIHCSCVAALRDRFGLKKQPIKVHEPFSMLGWVDDDLAEALGTSVISPTPRDTMFGFRNENWRPWRAPWGQEVLVSEHFHTATAPDGGLVIYAKGDLSSPPTAHMPNGGYYFDSIIRQEPINEEALNPDDNCEEFGVLSQSQLDEYAADCRQARASGRAVIAGLPGAALGDIALVPGPGLVHPKGIRDITEWYMSTTIRQDYVRAVFRKQTDIAIRNMQAISVACGDCIDVAYLCGTDFGTQNALFCSMEAFNGLWKPYYQEMTGWIHKNTRWKVFKHSCGAIEKLIPTFIECGFDILNPVQCSAAGMEAEHLKKTYGRHIVFWGGGVDTQRVLPFGTPADVQRQVRDRCRIFADGGGFVFNTVHNIQPRTPVDNIMAMLEALGEFPR